MNKIFLSLTLMLALLAGTGTGQKKPRAAARPAAKATPAAASAPAYEIPIVTKTLANGLEVIVLPDASIPLATVELDVRNGSFTEPPEYNGLSHLFEHMFFKPNLAVRLSQCEATPQAERNNDYYRGQCADAFRLKPQIGDVSYLRDSAQLGFTNATTREEVVSYFYVITTPQLALAMRQINDSVRYPAFDER